MRYAIPLIAVFHLTTMTAADDRAEFAIVGYLPSYRAEVFRPEQAELLTDLILFSVAPRPDGSLNTSRITPGFLTIVDQSTGDNEVRKLLTVSGWGKSDAFAKVTADAALRARFIQNLEALCEEHDLAGIDCDWEHPEGKAQQQACATFLIELKEALGQERMVTVAVAPWKPLLPEALLAVDRIHLMTYDNHGRHSTLDLAFDAVDALLEQGIPAEKICLGIPFYGRPYEGKFGKATTYMELRRKHPMLEPDDNEAAGIFFNGPELVARKVRLARRLGLGGVMVWEIGQDVSDPKWSLLHTIHRAATQSENNSP